MDWFYHLIDFSALPKATGRLEWPQPIVEFPFIFALQLLRYFASLGRRWFSSDSNFYGVVIVHGFLIFINKYVYLDPCSAERIQEERGLWEIGMGYCKRYSD